MFIGSIQSEKALQADTRRLLPLEFTLDNFTVILTKGEQKGRIFEQVTYLPDNIKKFYTAFANSTIVAVSVTVLTLLFGSLSAYTHRPPALPLDAVPAAGQHRRALRAGDRADDPALRRHALARAAQFADRRHHRRDRLPAALCHPDPGALLRHHPGASSRRPRASTAARASRAFVRIVLPLATPALAACGVIMFIISWHELLIPLILNARPDFMTLPVVIASLVGDVHVFFNLMMAICLLALLPTVILVALLQKYIVEGLSAGAVKG